jgi:hypothetical protein
MGKEPDAATTKEAGETAREHLEAGEDGGHWLL